jgi:hypothetical protein
MNPQCTLAIEAGEIGIKSAEVANLAKAIASSPA